MFAIINMNSGMTNPLTVIEQITYLMFIKNELHAGRDTAFARYMKEAMLGE